MSEFFYCKQYELEMKCVKKLGDFIDIVLYCILLVNRFYIDEVALYLALVSLAPDLQKSHIKNYE